MVLQKCIYSCMDIFLNCKTLILCNEEMKAIRAMGNFH